MKNYALIDEELEASILFPTLIFRLDHGLIQGPASMGSSPGTSSKF